MTIMDILRRRREIKRGNALVRAILAVPYATLIPSEIARMMAILQGAP